MAQDDYIRRINPVDFEPDVGIGLAFPLTSDHKTKFKLNYQTSDQTRDNLLNLLMTMKGERYMLPEYGTNLRKVLFETGDNDILSATQSIITDAIAMWMPLVIVNDIQLFQDVKNEHLFYIKMLYSTQYDVTQVEKLEVNITI